MRTKHIWLYVPLPGYTKLFWERITFSRLTVIYLTFSILHFLIQLVLQIRAFTINAAAFDMASAMVGQARINHGNLPFYGDSTLRICNWVPANMNFDTANCTIVWPPGNATAEMDNAYPTLLASSSTSTGVILEQTSSAGVSTSTQDPPLQTIVPAVLSSVPATLVSTTLGSTVTTPQQTTVPLLPSAASSLAGISASSSSAPQVNVVFLTSSTVVAAPTTTTVFVVAAPSPKPSSILISVAPLPTARTKAGSGSTEKDDEATTELGDANETTGDIQGLLRRDDSANTMAQIAGLTPTCQDALMYPWSILANTKREDIVFVAFQFWVLGMSIVALLNESIPHIFASLLTHVIATAWGGFQLVHTANFRREFNTVITKGACQTAKQLPISASYWEARKAAEIPSLILNVVALLVSCFLTWRLIKLFGWQTFKRVGASLDINRIYKLVLILSINIQLSLFFMAAAVSVWLDRLINNSIGDLATERNLYLASSIIVLILLIPWLMTGWFAARRELKAPMIIFLGLTVLYFGGWSVIFISTTFRWTFITWRFFSIITIASALLIITTFVLGLLCRLNFGKGLLRHLSSQEILPGDEFGIVTPEQETEKVDFPITEKPMPTFHAAYGSGTSAGGRMFITNGPRFFNQSPTQTNLALPPYALARVPSDRSTHSYSSDKSASSWDSYYTYSHSRDNSLHYGQPKRWVIE